jgi:hypothetical protein
LKNVLDTESSFFDGSGLGEKKSEEQNKHKISG